MLGGYAFSLSPSPGPPSTGTVELRSRYRRTESNIDSEIFWLFRNSIRIIHCWHFPAPDKANTKWRAYDGACAKSVLFMHARQKTQSERAEPGWTNFSSTWEYFHFTFESRASKNNEKIVFLWDGKVQLSIITDMGIKNKLFWYIFLNSPTPWLSRKMFIETSVLQVLCLICYIFLSLLKLRHVIQNIFASPDLK